MVILYEDDDILVVDKPAGLLTVSTDREGSRTAYFALTDHVRRNSPGPRSRIFIVHRLDRETSGILVFAKNEETKLILQGRWEETGKKYLAVVHGRLEKRSGTITSRLVENKVHRVYSTTDPNRGRLSHTGYRVLKETRNFSLLELDLLTGRKNQIRVHLADLGHPVVGDRKYGKPKDVHTRLALHSLSLRFQHPRTGAELSFAAPLPAHFNRMIRGADQVHGAARVSGADRVRGPDRGRALRGRKIVARGRG
jgi:tRNA pseudouridine32 synthase/23S rRNA pseudouridine746 synthase/23S rRNA pseudouridine1911/1915/1917 synthase